MLFTFPCQIPYRSMPVPLIFSSITACRAPANSYIVSEPKLLPIDIHVYGLLLL